MTRLDQYKFNTGEVDGVNCSIVETGATKERAEFIAELLRLNGYEAHIAEDAPPAKKPVKKDEEQPVEEEAPAPITYTVGVTDITFNPVMETFKRNIKTRNGHVVLPSYWNGGHVTQEWYWKETAV